MIPFYVVEGAPAVVEELSDDLATRGWPVRSGLVDPGPEVARVCVVDSADDVRAAVLAAVAGAALVIDARADRELTDVLCDDLRRLGRLEHLVGVASRPPLDADQRLLLDLLAEGRSLGQVAITLHVSRRSADRRLAAARLALGAASTAAAVSARRARLERVPRPAPD